MLAKLLYVIEENENCNVVQIVKLNMFIRDWKDKPYLHFFESNGLFS